MRLNRYHARHKPRPPRYPSLRLRFEEENSAAAVTSSDTESFLQPMVADSYQSLALEKFADGPCHPQLSSDAPMLDFGQDAENVGAPTAKIIEFPRSFLQSFPEPWTPTPAPLDELAEPVLDHPRILEAPEVVPPPPALGGITIEPAQPPAIEKRPGIDFPLNSAPLAQRILAATIDALIIAAACVLFGLIFWKMTAIRPPGFQLVGLAGSLPAIFWAAYQYLLIVYSGGTPGLRLARLQLSRFNGDPPGRSLRRWRILASFLSAASLGMGYAWLFLDEDALCWHDRITHTYLAPKAHA